MALVLRGAAGAAGRAGSCAAATLGAALVAALPWLIASVLGSSLTAHTAADRLGVEAFAPRAEPGLGTLVSLASLGGIWNGDAVPGSRATLFAVLSAVVLLGVVAAGLPTVARRPAAVPLLVLAAVSVLVRRRWRPGPAYTCWRGGDAAPGVGVLRDGQKWVALAMPGYTLAGAGAVVTLRRWLPPPTECDGADLLPGAAAGAARPGLGRLGQGCRRCTIRAGGPPSPRRSTPTGDRGR